jgi:hypothetical protein
MSTLNWALVHAADDPAISAWTAAAATAHAPKPRLVPWTDVLDGTARFGDGELVHAERLIPATPTRYGSSRERYERLAAALSTLHTRLAADHAAATTDPAAILLALDRKRCSEHLAAADVPVPEAGESFVRQRFAEPGDAISEDHGSVVITALAVTRTRNGFELRHTPHSGHYRGVDDEHAVDEAGSVRDLLAREDETFTCGELPTAYLDGAQYRFRFAVIDGQATHAAGRLADKPPAREYFGGRRREIDAYHRRFGAEAWHRLIGIAEQAAAAFPGLRAIGVDIAASQVKGPDVVYDIDPFGARLPAAPGLPGTAGEGLEVAATMLRSWMTR